MMAVVLLVNHSAAKLCRAHPFSASGYADIPSSMAVHHAHFQFHCSAPQHLLLLRTPWILSAHHAHPSYVLPNREYLACDAFLASTCSSGKPLNNA